MMRRPTKNMHDLDVTRTRERGRDSLEIKRDQPVLKEARVGFIKRLIRPERRNEAGRERVQSVMRIVIVVCLLAYLAAQQQFGLDLLPAWFIYLVGYLGVSAAVMALAFHHGASGIRRTVITAADISAVSYLMIATGESGVPL